MNRKTVWVGIIIGGAIYYSAKTALGFPIPKFGEFFDGAYWSGAALLIHWIVTDAKAASHAGQSSSENTDG